MNLQRKIIVSTSVSLLAFSALAQDKPGTKAYTTSNHQAYRLSDTAKARDVIGMEVKNYQDEKIGKVEDLAVDVESGRIVQVILSTGGFIGIGHTLTAVPPGAFHYDDANKILHLDASKEKLKGAPKFEASKWAEYSDFDHVTGVYGYYGAEPTFIQRGAGAGVSPNTVSSSNKASDKDGNWVGSESMIPSSRLGQVQKASKLMGMSVKNLQSESLGKVENLILDLSSGRVLAVIISSGGFLGMGDELSAVPPAALGFNSDRDTLQLDASRDLLAKSPHFKSNEWPDVGQPSYADGIYRAYRVEPYFTTNATASADNTSRNVRDRADRTLTPLDQGHNKADTETTAQIRKEIIASNGLSVNARNVKIITVDGRVTLRGPVKTEEEKLFIGEIANRIARSENVDNQLEVKLNTTSSN